MVENVKEERKKLKVKQKKYGDQHRKNGKELEEGGKIRYRIDHQSWRGGEIIQKNENLRSTIIQTDNGKQLNRKSGILHETNAISPENKEIVIFPNSQPEKLHPSEDVQGQNTTPEPRPSTVRQIDLLHKMNM
ncbi:hypothetical protein JTB14_026104 [Gonioctena quinquepunctata]|nr:hypothetical protein JTB14_026104 [Gonioctena quinquepunctata]